jgi:copper homeostasis protein
MKILLETVVDSVAAAMAAEAAGADRLELCSGLELGGLTPGIGLVRAVLAQVGIPVYVLVRPRGGDFHYRPDEIDVVTAEIAALREAGAHGVVVGALTAEGLLDEDSMCRWMAAAGHMAVTCHRAFDRIADQSAALERLVSLGVPRVLTSGGMPSAYEGMARLKELVAQAAGRIVVLAGAGVHAGNAREIVQVTGVQELHFSALRRVAGAPAANVQMGSLGAEAEGWHFVPDGEKVRGVVEALPQ